MSAKSYVTHECSREYVRPEAIPAAAAKESA
jgi:hypothetical protein